MTGFVIDINGRATQPKTPESVLDYTFDWTAWLASGEAITSSSVTPASGVAVVSSVASATTVTATLSGGTAGQLARITCLISTSQGRTEEAAIYLQITEP